jgi:hypothetical protein
MSETSSGGGFGVNAGDGAIIDAPPRETAPAPAPQTAPAPSAPPLGPSSRLEQLYAMLMPQNRRGLTREVLAKTEAEYFAEYARVHGLDAPEGDVLRARSNAPPAPPAVVFDAQQWEQILGPARGVEGDDTDLGADTTWDVPTLNTARTALESVGFSSVRVLGDLIDAERQMAQTEWSEAEGRAALARAHGGATAERMISNAQVMLELLYEHPVGRARISKWDQERSEKNTTSGYRPPR